MEDTPSIGNKTTGKSDVTGTGIASVDHQYASKTVTAATSQAFSLIVEGAGINIIIKKITTPKKMLKFPTWILFIYSMTFS